MGKADDEDDQSLILAEVKKKKNYSLDEGDAIDYL